MNPYYAIENENINNLSLFTKDFNSKTLTGEKETFVDALFKKYLL